MSAPRLLLPVFLLTILSGAAGLSHETVWVRVLVDVLGASVDTFAKVIGSFFLGLAFGALLASRLASSLHHIWIVIGLAEFGIAALSYVPLAAAGKSEWIYQQFGSSAGLDWILPPLLIGPPAILMGLVLPLMLHALGRSKLLVPRRALALYAANTAGGIFGIAAVILWLLPNHGQVGSWMVIAVANATAGGIAIFLHTMTRDQQTTTLSAENLTEPLVDSTPGLWTASLAFFSGFFILGLEVLVQIEFAQISVSSLHAGAFVLVIVLLTLTASAFLLPLLIRRVATEKLTLCILLAAAIACAFQPAVFVAISRYLSIVPYEYTAGVYLGKLIVCALASVVPVLVIGGFIFPLLMHQAVATRKGKHGSVGRQIGTLLMWNGVGGWLGAELVHLILTPRFDLWMSFPAISVGYFAFAIIFLLREGKRRVLVTVTTVAAVALTSATTTSRNLPHHRFSREPGDDEVVDYAVGREGIVTVVRSDKRGLRIAKNSHYTLGGSMVQTDQERQAHIPLLLHGSPTSVASLGVATASSIGGIALHQNVEEVDAIEISPLTLKLAREHFGPHARHVFDDPRVSFHSEDARRFVAGRNSEYDVVIGDLFEPWGNGVGRLYTVEHLSAVERSLKPGGVFCQWLGMKQLTRPEFDSIVTTFRSVFPNAVLVRRDFYVRNAILGLVGGVSLESHDWAASGAACARLRADNRISDPIVRNLEGLAMMVIGLATASDDAPINTLANSWIEFDAAKSVILKQDSVFTGGPMITYVNEVYTTNQQSLPIKLRPAQKSGNFFQLLEAATFANKPIAATMRAEAENQMPNSLRSDPNADWKTWPMETANR